MAQSAKLTPNLNQQGTKALNLTVLQRIDPFIEEILLTAVHVTFYEFNIESNQWSRKDVEGSLFVVKRNTQPRFQFIVMNRRNTENLVENLLGDFEYEVQVPYLLYRNASQEVNGIWFYNSRDCEDVANLFNRILNAYSKVPSKPNLSTSKREYEELEAVPTMSVMEGPLEPPSTTTVPEESPFENFFNKAMAMGTSSSNANSPPLPATVVPTPVVVPQMSSKLPAATAPPLDNSAPAGIHHVATLVKPSSFLPPTSSTSLQRPYGTPLLQPFPPPTPPASLTPASAVISREKVQNALISLVQDDLFVDLFHQALMKSQFS